MTGLDGVWSYESFCPTAGSPTRAPQIAAPWSPRGTMKVTTDAATGKVTGSLQFAPKVALEITGSMTPAEDGLPAGIALSGEGLGSISRLRGYFVADKEGLVIGTVVAIQNDLARQPDGTSGVFVLVREGGA